ncbi:MAG: hypothetical protein RLZZ127_596, partial [Planctomycetota bacterium]
MKDQRRPCSGWATYRYDALGRRVAKTFQGRRTVFVQAGAQVVSEIESAAIPTPP